MSRINITPDVSPSGVDIRSGGSAGPRLFKFEFTANSSSYDVFTSAKIANEETIAYFAKNGDSTNLINQNYISSAGSNAVMDYTNNKISFLAHIFQKTLEISNLEVGAKYYFITTSTYNDPEVDVELELVPPPPLVPPEIAYIQAGSIRKDGTLYDGVNLVPDVLPNGEAVGTGDIRYFKYKFIPNSASVDVYISSDSQAGGDFNGEIFTYINGPDNINLIPTNIANLENGAYIKNSNTIALANSMIGNRAFTINNLTSGVPHYFIIRPYRNSAGADVTMAMFDSTTGTETSISFEKYGFLVKDSTVFGTNVISELAPNGRAINSSTGTRYFQYSFIASSDLCDVYIQTATGGGETILNIFPEGGANIINSTNIKNLSGVSISGTTIPLTASIAAGRAFSISGLSASQKYNIIFRTTDNSTIDADIRFGILDGYLYNDLDLSYDKTGCFITADNSTIFGEDIIPNVSVTGVALPAVGLTEVRMFKFSFVPTSDKVDMYLSSTSSSSTQERIISIFKDDGVNILSTSANVTNVASITGFSYSSVNGEIIPANNQPNTTRALTLNNLSSNSTYYLVARTINNGTLLDLAMGLLDGTSGLPVPIVYDSTSYLSNGYQMFDGMNLIPDTLPNSSTSISTSNPRLFRFAFIPTNTTCDVYISSNSSSAAQERILYIGKVDAINIIETDLTNITALSGFSRTGGIITVPNTMPGTLAFRLNNLDTASTYYIISSTTSNDTTTTDLRMAILNTATKVEVEMVYDRTGPLLAGANIIDGVNAIQDTFPNSTTTLTSTTVPRLFKFSFVPSSSSCDVLIATNSNASSQEKIMYIGTNNSININSTHLTNIVSGVTVTNSIINLAASMRGIRAFTLNSLVEGTTYYIIFSSTSNDASDPEVRMAVVDAFTTSIIPIEYIDTNLLMNGHMLYSGIDLVPNVGPNNEIISTGVGLGYFRFKFVPTTMSCDVLIASSSSSNSQDRILSIYKEGGTNIISTNITNFNGMSVSGGRLQFSNSMRGNRAFTIDNLDAGATYYIIHRSTSNDTFDVQIGMIDSTTFSPIELLYDQFGYFVVNSTILYGHDMFPNVDTTGAAITTGSGARYFAHSFTATREALTLFLTTYYSVGERILTIFKQSSNTNIIPTHFSPVTGTSIDTNNIIFNGIQSEVIGGLFNNLDVGSTYIILTYTNSNDSFDAVIGILDSNTTPVPLTYLLTSTTIPVPTSPTNVAASIVPGTNNVSVSFTTENTNGIVTTYTATSSPGGVTSSASSSPVIITGLTGSEYTFTVVASNGFGTSSASAPSDSLVFAAIPDAPTAVTAIAGNGEATVSFTPGADRGYVITGYTVTSSPGGLVASGASGPIVVSGLTNGTEYTFTVVATNSAGTSVASAPSNVVIPILAPNAPPAPPTVQNTTSGTVSVSLLPPIDNGGPAITGYVVYVYLNNQLVRTETAPASESSISISGLNIGSTYKFKYAASNGALSGLSDYSADIILSQAPDTPTDLFAMDYTFEAIYKMIVQFKPAFNGGLNDVTFTVTSSPGGVTATRTAQDVNEAGYIIIDFTELAHGVPYTFTVKATNARGDSAESAPTEPRTIPFTPKELALQTLVSLGVLNNEASFVSSVQSATFSAETSITTSALGFDITRVTGNNIKVARENLIAYIFEDKPSIISFKISKNDIGFSSNQTIRDNVVVLKSEASGTLGDINLDTILNSSTSVYTPLALEHSGNPYLFQNTSFWIARVGNSSQFRLDENTGNGITTYYNSGDIITYKTLLKIEFGSVIISKLTVPDAPAAVTAVAGNGEATVSFTPGADGGAAITSYTVTSSPGGLVATGASGPIVVSGLTNGTEYTFTVVATNTIGSSVASAPSNGVVPVAPTTVPDAPTAVTAIAGNGEATVSFTPGADGGAAITSYTVTSSPGGLVATGASGPIVVSGLTNGTEYTFTVMATNSIGSSVASAPSNGVVPVAPTTVPDAPTAVTAVAGNGEATVSFTPGADGGAAITSYTATSSPDNISVSGASSPITLTGLTNNVARTFTVVATNSVGNSLISAPSNSVIFNLSATEAHTPIEVNFNVEVGADGNLTVFGDQFLPPTNVIIAERRLPVNALYDGIAKKGLIELWEPSADPDNIYCKLASTNNTSQGGYDFTNSYRETLKKLAKGLQYILCDKMDCVYAAPYLDSKYAGIPEYTNQRDFARVALGAFAHFLFGHIDATAGITNDTNFIISMLSLNESANGISAAINENEGGATARYAEYNTSIVNEIDNLEIENWTNKVGTASDANLARRLVAAIINKGLKNGQIHETKVNNPLLSDSESRAELAWIVRQVVGQDASRLMDEDNSQRTKDLHQLLRFYPDDVIYVNIRLNTPQIIVGAGNAITGATLAENYTQQNYTIKITLGPVDN
jgi:hypothetical protein